MVSIMRLFLRVLVREFYVINAGYFLFFFILFFGEINPADLVFFHTSLILSMFNEPLFMGAVMLVWLFYNFKCIFFGSKTLNKPENSFLVNLQSFSFRKQSVIFFTNH